MVKSTLRIISVTIVAVAMTATLFLNSILGVFGLVSTSVGTLTSLKESQLAVNRMKDRHKVKKDNVSKRFVKKSGKRIASTAVAASTIGTVAVVLTVASLEVNDYCDENKELVEDENILYGTEKEFDYESCLKEGKDHVIAIMESVKNDSSIAAKSAWENAKTYSNEIWDEVKERSIATLNSTTEAAADLWDSLKKWVSD